MSKYVTITPSNGATSATANVTISTGAGRGQIYICNKDAAIKDRVNNSLAQSTVISENMYFLPSYQILCTYASSSKCYDGNYVYFNPTTGSKCTNYTNSQSYVGVKSGCMKWYVFNDNSSSNKVNLLLDHNTTGTVAWNSSGSVTYGPTTALSQLKSDTSSWTGVLTPTNYTYSSSYASYTINYSGYKARLITEEEIRNIAGLPNIYNYLLNDYGNYGWVYDRTGMNCKDYGCLNNAEYTVPLVNGYLTSSAHRSTSGDAYIVNSHSGLYNSGVSSANYGIRPVIEVLKSKLY